MLEVTKISSKGQITVPIELRKKLNLSTGGKLAFIEGEDGRIYVVNSSMLALRTAQASFKGVAKTVGINNENELLEIIKTVKEN
ncbi:MAG: AbrB/MazE/SpoVT family DNA-binding domain-containing protein [Clostridia bacterium]|nr:AbrB/MazE/SpoVT family DNA-binding domain-containing protein [Clostridia bacterium]